MKMLAFGFLAFLLGLNFAVAVEKDTAARGEVLLRELLDKLRKGRRFGVRAVACLAN